VGGGLKWGRTGTGCAVIKKLKSPNILREKDITKI